MNETAAKILLFFGTENNLLSTIIVTIFTGIGSIFIQNEKKVNYFDEKFEFNQPIIKKFFNDNIELYIQFIGWYAEAKKHGILFNDQQVIEFINSQKEFQENNIFSNIKFQQFLKDNKITEKDIKNYFKKLLIVNTFKNIFKHIPEYNKFKNIVNKLTIKGKKILISNNYEKKTIDLDNFQYFLKKNINNKNNAILNLEERKGFLIVLNKNFNNLNNYDNYQELIQSFNHYSTKKEIEDVFEKIYKISKDNYEVISLDFHKKGQDKISNLLFNATYNKFEELDGKYYGVILTDIKSPIIKSEDKIDIKYFEEMYNKELNNIDNFLYANQIVNDINNSFININSITSKFFNEDITIDIKEIQNNPSVYNLFFLKPGNANIYISNENEICIFVLKEIIHDKSTINIGELNNFITNDYLINYLISYWLSHFEYKNI